MGMEESMEGLTPTRRLGQIKLPVSDQKINYYTLLQKQFPIINFSDIDTTQAVKKEMSAQNQPSVWPGEKSLPGNMKKLKIAILSWDNLFENGPGMESMTMAKLAATLSQRGHKVHVFTTDKGGKAVGRKLDGVTLHAIPIDSRLSWPESTSVFANKICEHLKRIESCEEPFRVIHCYDWQAIKAIINLHSKIPRKIIFTPSTKDHRQEWPSDSRDRDHVRDHVSDRVNDRDHGRDCDHDSDHVSDRVNDRDHVRDCDHDRDHVNGRVSDRDHVRDCDHDHVRDCDHDHVRDCDHDHVRDCDHDRDHGRDCDHDSDLVNDRVNDCDHNCDHDHGLDRDHVNGRGHDHDDNGLLCQKDLSEQELMTISDAILCFDHGLSTKIQKRFALSCEKISTITDKDFDWENYQWLKDPGQVKKKYDIFPLDPLILFVGELNNEYGSDILVDAIPSLLNNTPGLRFVLVGDGEHLWSIKVKARYMGYEHAIRLVGHKEGKDLQELFQAADILVIPSRTSATPFQVLAGWSSKKPIVATYVGGCNLITHEKNGLLVQDNRGSLHHGLERILFNWEKGHEIAQKGWDTIQENYSWESMVQKVESLYQ